MGRSDLRLQDASGPRKYNSLPGHYTSSHGQPFTAEKR